MRTGPLPPHLKERVLANIANAKKSQVITPPVDTPMAVEPPQTGTPRSHTNNFPDSQAISVVTPQMGVSQAHASTSTTDISGPMKPNVSNTADQPSDTMTSVPDDNTSDGGSYTSTLPDVFNVDMDGPEPLAVGPWVAIDHLTGEIIAGGDDPTVPTPPQTGRETGTLPPLSIHVITETEPPALLFEDKDVRPEWLTLAVKEFLRYTPYYGRLGKVIDLFLAQEARLGYPNLVRHLHPPSSCLNTDNAKSVRLALPSNNWPTKVGQFQKWARKYSRGDDIDAAKFSVAVLKWWITIQPTTRKQWPPTYNPLPGNFSFDYFNHGGPNGVFLMILCLGWWVNALTADMDLTDYTLVVNDVCWVLEQIANQA